MVLIRVVASRWNNAPLVLLYMFLSVSYSRAIEYLSAFVKFEHNKSALKCSGQKSLDTFFLIIWWVSINAVLTVKTHGQTTEEGARLPREQQVLYTTLYTFSSLVDLMEIFLEYLWYSKVRSFRVDPLYGSLIRVEESHFVLIQPKGTNSALAQIELNLIPCWFSLMETNSALTQFLLSVTPGHM